MEKMIFSTLDGSVDEQTEALKKFFGLSPDQSFQELDVGDDEDD